MKKLKQIVAQIKAVPSHTTPEFDDLLWQYICYAPKMPLRLPQENLLNTAQKFSLKVHDKFFTQKELNFNVFKWGSGTRKVILTHGWGSKAADFIEIITALSAINDLEIIAFDAPGNGSSEGELSNFLLYVEALKAVILQFGQPDILIGHSLGAMANIFTLKELAIKPKLLISLTPLIKLKENFESSLNAIGISAANQYSFFNDFEAKFKTSISNFTVNNWYAFEEDLNHWLAYDQNDQVVPFSYLKTFLEAHPAIKSQNYIDVGHDKILKSPEVIGDLINVISTSLNLSKSI
ncbi:MAG: alpha/beta fold hydrolase [Janthinobacterium lividum]